MFQKEILSALGSICSHLGKSAQECDMIVHEYGPSLINMIRQELPPSEICSLIKLCKSKTQVEYNNMINLNWKPMKRSDLQVAIQSSELECEVCKLVAEQLDNLLKEDSTEVGLNCRRIEIQPSCIHLHSVHR